MTRYRLLRNLAAVRPDIQFTYEPNHLDVRLSDADLEQGIRFGTIQGFRVTTVDAYDLDDSGHDELEGSDRWGVFEIPSSSWLAEMDKVVREHDSDADFMESSHHFVIFGYDLVLEVAAFSVDVADPEARTDLKD